MKLFLNCIYIKFLRIAFLSLLIGLALKIHAQTDVEVANKLLTRIAPSYVSKVAFVQLKDCKIDHFELESSGPKVVIAGNNANSMAVGLNHFLKYYCLTNVSWYASNPVQLPTKFPQISSKISIDARSSNRFFLNYCTFGYTMPWWKWADWERFIDWMALNGINLPLATTGQESVWYKVWIKMGLSDSEIRNFYSGPAHLPWNRMSNIDSWQGGLPDSWLKNQEELQRKIVIREREFNMKPVLPAFAGHVPQVIKKVYPNAKISQMSPWGGFEDKYRSFFLDPLDPLFKKIQAEFINEQTRMYGTSNVYAADPFNEIESPSWDPEYLATVSNSIYTSIKDVDANATWIQMTWFFYNDRAHWTNSRVKSFLRAVPQDKMLLLDYFAEDTEVYKQTEKYFGQPYLWCYLGNFGGNSFLAGDIKEVGKRIEEVYKNGGDNFWGLGATLEGFDANPFMYEYVFEKAWNNKMEDNLWMQKLADRYVGKPDKNFRAAYKYMLEQIYIKQAKLGQGTLTNARPLIEGPWTPNIDFPYKNRQLSDIWGLMLQSKFKTRDRYLYNLVNTGRQVLGNYYNELYNKFMVAYRNKNIAKMKIVRNEMLDLMCDIDLLSSKHPDFSLQNWIESAKSFGVNEQEKTYYENNARTILTTWGDRNSALTDYCNRNWSGLTATYYKPRWEMFLDDVIQSVVENKPFDKQVFHDKVTAFEVNWTKTEAGFVKPDYSNTYQTSKILFEKYNKKITE